MGIHKLWLLKSQVGVIYLNTQIQKFLLYFISAFLLLDESVTFAKSHFRKFYLDQVYEPKTGFNWKAKEWSSYFAKDLQTWQRRASDIYHTLIEVR